MNVEIETKTTTYAGLFGYIENGTLRNLGVWLAPEGIEVSSTQFGYISAGGLAGYVTETDSKTPASIQNCYVEGEGNITVRSTDNTIKINVGGMVGVTNGNLGTCIITHCYTTVDVEAEVDSRSTSYVGSIAGRTSNISYTYATGNVKVKERKKGKMPFVGGICGHATNGTITNCVALNKEISSPGSDQCFRICRSGSGTNYASPRMIINGQPVTGNDPVSKNGTDIWLENFKETLSGTSGNNEWTTAWSWTEGELPRLKKLNTNGTTYSNELISGQKVRSQSACLYHSTWESKTNIAQSIENAPPAGTDEPGDGLSPDKPILIKNAAELAYLAQQVNTGGYVLEVKNGNKIDNEADSYKQGFSGYYFALSDDIKLDGGLWTPIGHMHIFCGHFDGKGHTVDGLRIDQIDGYIGLFGCVNDGTICNLGVRLHEDGIKVASSYPKDNIFAGGIVGYLLGLNIGASLRNCFVVGDGKVEITAGYQGTVGAIAGSIKSSDSHSALLTHCYSTVDVEATTENQCYAGGIVGRSNSILSYTYATGSVKTNNATEQSAGGICGRREGGELTHNLALNSEVTVSGGSDSHRITGSNLNDETSPGSSFNYACPSMSLKNQPFTDDPSSLDGANTWADQFRNDLQNIPASPSDVNEWTTAWIWPDTPSGQPALLPQLKRLNPDGTYPEGSSADNLLAGQPSLATVDFLSVQPDPASSIENLGGGDGSTAATPIRIRNAVELAYLARQVNNGGQTLQLLYGKSIDNTADDNLKGFAGYHFALSDDIDLKRQNWTPIGNEDSPFMGNFNGDGHVIKGLKISIHNETDADVYAGLFGYVLNSTFCNLGVWLAPEGIDIFSSQSDIYAGGLAGYIFAYIHNCYVEAEGNGTIRCRGTGDNFVYIGGIAGVMNKVLTHCYTTVNMEAINNNKVRIGGIVGQGGPTITYTYATGNIKCSDISARASIGGIMGRAMPATIKNCLALNKEFTTNNITGKVDFNRILGDGPTAAMASYSTPSMMRNGKPVPNGPDTNTDAAGADTWTDKFKEDLLKEPSDNNEWATAWEWADGKLPCLKKSNPDGSYSSSLIAGQTPRQADDFLYHSPWADNAVTSIENATPSGASQPGDGSSPNTPILIKDAAELAYLAQQVNAGGYVLEFSDGSKIDNASEITKRGFSGYYFSLFDDIKLEGGNWIPIGDDNSFRGHFDGKGHTVDGLRVDVVKENSSENTSDNTPAYAGLFGYVEDGTLCNLGVRLHEDGIKAVSNNNDAFAGGIVGLQIGFEDNTLLRNCFVVGNGKVEATAEFSGFAGGIAGLISFSVPNSATLTHCYATVDVEATANITCCAGGIAGSSYGRLSYTYATGSVKTNKTNQYAGGICGDIVSGELTHSLALNSEVTANGANAHRIASNSFPPDPPSDLLPVLDANYARPAMLLNNGSDSGSTTVTSSDGTSLDGADTWPAPATTVTSGTLGSPVISVAQPDLDAADYLVNRPLLHVTQPAEGGTLAVYLADPANPTAPAPGTPTLTDGTNGSESIPVVPGTALWLTNIPKAGYDFKAYLSGPASDGVTQPVSGQSLTMTAADLWITASFTAQAPPPTPVYYDVTLPSVEGATTDPAAGTYSVEAKESFRFFLTLDEAYSQSQPVVITDRGETITPRTSDGAYIVKTVHSDVSISIAGIVENDPVANESIAAPSDALRIWTEPGTLCIDLDITNRTSTDTDTVPSVRIISADGRLLHDFRLVPGLNRRNLAPGLYIIQAGQTVRKVIVK
ncbi:T9SS type A sorting domain-containing protein [Parabacteroides goldsteinii]|uniref:T9SS type A sorting domain-containing protein n=1 Tax=Parabacteroides goldsteinii TaxID=328812 RepID=UPI0025708BB9|nr:T9SS type A sorting domain-containing protein [Parabacteroides goldsteinii]